MAQAKRIPMGRLPEHRPEHPECTAYRSGCGIFEDSYVRTWTSRAAMLKACEMSDTGKMGALPWRPWPDAWTG